MVCKKIWIFLTLFAVTIATPVSETNNEVEAPIEETIANFLEREEFEFDVPSFGAKVTLGARNLEDEEIDVKVKLTHDDQARKSKLKKIFAPILILVILKAITLIPLALGVLGLKTWNAIQLSFVTFIISIALAVFEMCKKIAWDHAHVHTTHSSPWPSKRSMEGDAQNLAYSAYTQ